MRSCDAIVAKANRCRFRREDAVIDAGQRSGALDGLLDMRLGAKAHVLARSSLSFELPVTARMELLPSTDLV